MVYKICSGLPPTIATRRHASPSLLCLQVTWSEAAKTKHPLHQPSQNEVVKFMFAAVLLAPGTAHCLLLQICEMSLALFCYEMEFLNTITCKQPEGDGDVITYSPQKCNHWNHTSKLPSAAAEWLAKIPPHFTSWEFDSDSSWLLGKKIMKLILNESGSAVKGSLILWT